MHSFRQVLLLVVVATFSSTLFAISVGQTREAVIREKGAPVTVAEGNGRSILTFADGTVATLADGRVKQISSRPVYAETTSAARSNRAPANRASRATTQVDNRRVFFGVLAGLVAAALLSSVFFRRPGDFSEAMRFSVQPDWVSALQGEWGADQLASAKLGCWLLVSVGVGYLVYSVLG